MVKGEFACIKFVEVCFGLGFKVGRIEDSGELFCERCFLGFIERLGPCLDMKYFLKI